MPTELFRRCSAKIREVEAADLGCDVADFDSNALVVVPRPAKVLYPEYGALIVSCGTGTVVSVDDAHVAWVRENAPRKHWHAFSAAFTTRLAAQIGEKASARGASLGFAPSGEPPTPVFDARFRLDEPGRDWMDEWRTRAQFDNSLGEAEEADWYDRLVKAFVAFDEQGEPAACVTLADDGNGCAEIGLDVRRAWRGQGLARPLVGAAMRWAFARGFVPYYTCGASNVRSHLVAESCGFRALWTVTGVIRDG